MFSVESEIEFSKESYIYDTYVHITCKISFQNKFSNKNDKALWMLNVKYAQIFIQDQTFNAALDKKSKYFMYESVL